MSIEDNDKEINQLTQFICKRWEKYDVSEIAQLVRYVWENASLSIKDLSEVDNNSQSQNNYTIHIEAEVLKGITKNFCSSLKMRPKNWNKLAKDYNLGDGIDEYEIKCSEDDKDDFTAQKFNQFLFYKEVSLPYVMKKYVQTKTTPLIVLIDAINKQAYLTQNKTLDKNENQKRKFAI